MSRDIQITNKDGSFANGQHFVVFNSVGRLVMLSGRNKLIQDVEKILFTNINYFYSQYKTQLDELIGSNLKVEQTINVLSQRITDSLIYLQFLQEQQSKYQQVQSSEIIQQIVTLNVNYLYHITNNDNDVRTFTVQIVILTAGNQMVTVNRDITIV